MEKEIFLLTKGTLHYHLFIIKDINLIKSEFKKYFSEKDEDYFTRDVYELERAVFTYDGDDFEEMFEKFKQYLLLREII